MDIDKVRAKVVAALRADGVEPSEPSAWLWILRHDDGADKYIALISHKPGKDPRLVAPEEMRRYLCADELWMKTDEPPGVLAEGKKNVRKYYINLCAERKAAKKAAEGDTP